MTNPTPTPEVIKLDNLFTEQELQELNDLFDHNLATKENIEPFKPLGRLNILLYGFPQHLTDKLTNLVNSKLDTLNTKDYPLELVLAPVAVEYSAAYGAPQLTPHFDGDWTDLIIDFQLSSNVSWPLGVEFDTYTLEDNSAIAFNPNTNIHWRPNRDFQDGEYVRMIFFRFFNHDNPTNNDGIEVAKPDDVRHTEIRKFRDSLTSS